MIMSKAHRATTLAICYLHSHLRPGPRVNPPLIPRGRSAQGNARLAPSHAGDLHGMQSLELYTPRALSSLAAATLRSYPCSFRLRPAAQSSFRAAYQVCPGWRVCHAAVKATRYGKPSNARHMYAFHRVDRGPKCRVRSVPQYGGSNYVSNSSSPDRPPPPYPPPGSALTTPYPPAATNTLHPMSVINSRGKRPNFFPSRPPPFGPVTPRVGRGRGLTIGVLSLMCSWQQHGSLPTVPLRPSNLCTPQACMVVPPPSPLSRPEPCCQRP